MLPLRRPARLGKGRSFRRTATSPPTSSDLRVRATRTGHTGLLSRGKRSAVPPRAPDPPGPAIARILPTTTVTIVSIPTTRNATSRPPFFAARAAAALRPLGGAGERGRRLQSARCAVVGGGPEAGNAQQQQRHQRHDGDHQRGDLSSLATHRVIGYSHSIHHVLRG